MFEFYTATVKLQKWWKCRKPVIIGLLFIAFVGMLIDKLHMVNVLKKSLLVYYLAFIGKSKSVN
jgi:hypothetical protein